MVMIHERIKEIVDSLGQSLKSTNVELVDNKLKVYLCCTSFIAPCSVVKINNVEFEVLDVKTDEYIVLETSILIALPFNVVIEAPFFFHGTVTNTATEVGRISSCDEKYPMVYLYEPIVEEYKNSRERVDFEAELTLFFLDETNFKDWVNEEHYKYSISAMRKLIALFIEAINKKVSVFGEVETYKIINHSKMGIDLGENPKLGHLKNLFPNFTSGCELIINLQFLKTNSCKKCTC